MRTFALTCLLAITACSATDIHNLPPGALDPFIGEITVQIYFQYVPKDEVPAKCQDPDAQACALRFRDHGKSMARWIVLPERPGYSGSYQFIQTFVFETWDNIPKVCAAADSKGRPAWVWAAFIADLCLIDGRIHLYDHDYGRFTKLAELGDLVAEIHGIPLAFNDAYMFGEELLHATANRPHVTGDGPRCGRHGFNSRCYGGLIQ